MPYSGGLGSGGGYYGDLSILSLQQGLGIGDLGKQPNLLEDREDLLHLRCPEYRMEFVSLLLTECLAEALDKRPVKMTHVLAGRLQAQQKASQLFRISHFFVQVSVELALQFPNQSAGFSKSRFHFLSELQQSL